MKKNHKSAVKIIIDGFLEDKNEQSKLQVLFNSVLAIIYVFSLLYGIAHFSLLCHEFLCNLFVFEKKVISKMIDYFKRISRNIKDEYQKMKEEDGKIKEKVINE